MGLLVMASGGRKPQTTDIAAKGLVVYDGLPYRRRLFVENYLKARFNVLNTRHNPHISAFTPSSVSATR